MIITGIESRKGFAAGTLIGILGGLVGLGGAEFRLPVLIGMSRFSPLEAIIFNKAMSLVVVAAALVFRVKTISVDVLAAHVDVVVNLLAGSLIGAWWAAGHAVTMPRLWLNRIILMLLLGLSVVMLSEAWLGMQHNAAPLFTSSVTREVVGVIAGFGIGVVAALLGVAGGELLIPTIVLLFGQNIKVAGSLSLMVSLSTMIVGFLRYTSADAFAVLHRTRSLFVSMAGGSVVGAALGGMMLGLVPTQILLTLLGVILFVSAVKTYQDSH